MAKLKPLWNSHALTLKSKITMCRTLVWPVVAHACEGWTLRKPEESRLQACEMKMLRQILGISWQEHKTNESILQETGYTQELLTSIKRRKLTYAGHIARSQNSLEKTVMQGRVPGKRSRGRPRKSWMDNITAWTGLSADRVERMAHDRVEWRKIVRNAAKPCNRGRPKIR